LNRSLFAALAVAALIALAAFFIFQNGDEEFADGGLGVPESLQAESVIVTRPADPAGEDTETGVESQASADRSTDDDPAPSRDRSESPAPDASDEKEPGNSSAAVADNKDSRAEPESAVQSDGKPAESDQSGEDNQPSADRSETNVAVAPQGDDKATGSKPDKAATGGQEKASDTAGTVIARQDDAAPAVKAEADNGPSTSSDKPSKAQPQTGQTEIAALPALRSPSFDVVRISAQDCTAVLAGRAAPGSVVRLSGNGEVIATLQADGAGEWVHLILDPLDPGSVTLSLASEQGGRSSVSENDVVLIVPDCARPGENDTAVALLTPKSGGRTIVLQEPAAENADASPDGLNVGKVDYDDEGKVSVSGSSEPGREIRAYVDDAFVGRAQVDSDGRWTVIPETEIKPGLHVLRVDQVNAEGVVIARVELPFARARPGSLDLAVDQVVVQPGNSLWRIARRTYGSGTSYSVIFRANSDRIRDPDLIYPGQVFRLPPQDAGHSN